MNRSAHSPRALTVLSIAILITTPALIRFASNELALFDLLVYLAIAIGIVFGGLSAIGWIWDRYTTPEGNENRGTE
jgi:hypothetical protein